MAHTSGNYFLGNEFFVYLSDVSTNGDVSTNAAPFAYSTSCTLSLSANTIDTSNKQSGYWASALPGQISWSVSTNALYTTQNNYKKMYEIMAGHKQVYVRFGQVTNVEEISSPDASTAAEAIELDKSAGYYGGKAYISSIELNAGNNEVASFTAQFTGDGVLNYLEQ